MHLSLKSSLGRQILTGSYVKDNRVLDLTTPFSELTFTLADKSGEGNDATLYSGRYISTDGSTDRGIVADCSAAGAGSYYLTGKVRPNAVTTAELTMDGSTDSGLTGLTADVWQTFTTATSAVTPSAVQVGYDGSTASAADWSDVKLIDSSDGSTVARWQLNESADGDLNGYPALDSVGGYHGTHIGCAGGTGETTILQTAGMDWNKRMWFDMVNDSIQIGSNINFGSSDFSVDFSIIPLSTAAIALGGGSASTRWLFKIDDANTWSIRENNTATVRTATFDSALALGSVYDLTLSRSGDTLSLTLNGTLQASSIAMTAGATLGYSEIGSGAVGTTSLFEGLIYGLSDSLGTTWNGSQLDAIANGWTVVGTPSNYLIPASDTTPTNDALGNAIAEPRPTADTWNLFGDGEYGRVADADSLDLTTEATWELWGNFNYDSSAADEFALDKTSYRIWKNNVPDNSRLYFSFAGAAYYIIVPDSLCSIHLVYKGATPSAVCYINGIAVAPIFASGVLGSSISVNTDPLKIGNDIAGIGFYKRKISRPKIYNRALTADEVLQNFNAQKSSFGL